MKGIYNNSFILSGSGYVTVIKDSYKDGEIGGIINDWLLDEQEIILHDLDKQAAEITAFIIKYMNDNLFSSIDNYSFNILEDGNIYWSQEANRENMEPTDKEWKDFKACKIDLYNQSFIFTFKINGIEIDIEDLKELMDINKRKFKG